MLQANTTTTRLPMKSEIHKQEKLRNISPIRPFSRYTAPKATPSESVELLLSLGRTYQSPSLFLRKKEIGVSMRVMRMAIHRAL